MATLSSGTRNSLPESMFGLPKERKYPMPDMAHVIQAKRFFNSCAPEQRAELREAIERREKELTTEKSATYKQAFFESLTQHLPDAIGVAKHLGIGAGIHLGANAAFKYMRSGKSQFGNIIRKNMSELGVAHSIEGKQAHPWVMDRLNQVFGPEVTADYRTARGLYGKLKEHPPDVK